MSKRNRKNARVSSSLDVVITTAGRFDCLRDCLAALDKQNVPHNIYIIDIASDPEERIANQGLFDGRNTKRLKQNVGYASAANEGVRMGSAPLVLILNDDVTLFDGALEQMIQTMNDQTVGVCGAQLIFPPASTSPIRPAGKIQHIGLALNIRGEIIHPLVGWSVDNPKIPESRDVFATTGACFMIRRSLFNKAGGFDLAYGLGTFEDVDLCLKVRQMGHRIYVNMNAKGYHYTGATAEKKQVSFPIQNNFSIFRSKWSGTPFFVWDEYSWY